MTDNFVRFLEQHKQKKLFLIGLGGNSGDTLLRKGLELYLQENKYKVSSYLRNADMIIIHGGGSISDLWHSGLTLFKNVTKSYADKTIVIAPHTIRFFKTNFETVLNSCKQKIHFFVREKSSFEQLHKMRLNNNIKVYLANDTALLLQDTSYLSSIQKQNRFVLLSFRLDRESKLLGKSLSFKMLESVLGMFGLETVIRNQADMLSVHRASGTIKSVMKLQKSIRQLCGGFLIRKRVQNYIEKKYKHEKIRVTDASLESYEDFVSLISNASVVYTDRLHVAILGAMLGKRVHLYNDKYDKIKDVYEQSLQAYPNVIKKF